MYTTTKTTSTAQLYTTLVEDEKISPGTKPKIFVGQSGPKKIDKKSDPHRATFLNVAYKANILHKKSGTPND